MKKWIAGCCVAASLLVASMGCAEEMWYDYGVGSHIPKIELDSGKEPSTEFVINTDSSLYMQVKKTTDNDYKNYENMLKENGFTIDAEQTMISYEAYNEDGYHVNIIKAGDVISVDADAPKAVGTLKWPRSEIAQLLPVPESTTGNVLWEATYGFVAYVGDTDKESYGNYVDQCMDAGFTVDYRKGDSYYYAGNSDGYKLSLKYEGFNTMFVRIDEPDEE